MVQGPIWELNDWAEVAPAVGGFAAWIEVAQDAVHDLVDIFGLIGFADMKPEAPELAGVCFVIFVVETCFYWIGNLWHVGCEIFCRDEFFNFYHVLFCQALWVDCHHASDLLNWHGEFLCCCIFLDSQGWVGEFEDQEADQDGCEEDGCQGKKLVGWLKLCRLVG